MDKRAVGVAFVAMVAAAGVNLKAQNTTGAVRPEHKDLRALIVRGVERSATFRSLVDRLNTGDVVVYVRFARCNGDLPTCLVWGVPGPEVRRLMIKVSRFGLSPDALVALLGHELQHACEVAAEPGIIDAASFRTAFERRGWANTDGFETAEARDVGRQIRRDLMAFHPKGSGADRR